MELIVENESKSHLIGSSALKEKVLAVCINKLGFDLHENGKSESKILPIDTQKLKQETYENLPKVPNQCTKISFWLPEVFISKSEVEILNQKINKELSLEESKNSNQGIELLNYFTETRIRHICPLFDGKLAIISSNKLTILEKCQRVLWTIKISEIIGILCDPGMQILEIVVYKENSRRFSIEILPAGTDKTENFITFLIFSVFEASKFSTFLEFFHFGSILRMSSLKMLQNLVCWKGEEIFTGLAESKSMWNQTVQVLIIAYHFYLVTTKMPKIVLLQTPVLNIILKDEDFSEITTVHMELQTVEAKEGKTEESYEDLEDKLDFRDRLEAKRFRKLFASVVTNVTKDI